MSAEISPLLVRTPAAARPLWLRLRRSSPFTLTVLMCCPALLWVSPFIWMLATSFSATTFGDDMASLLPRLPLTLDNFRDARNSADWLSLYANTLIFTFGTFFVQLLTITTAGYVFAPRISRQADAVSPVLVQLMIMPVVMMVPNMLTLKTFGLLNTLTGVMMPYFTSAFGVFLMRQAFLAIPKELEEAALMEGCRWWQVLFRVLLPMSRPSVLAFATVSITYHWNEYLWPLMMLNDPDKQVLTVGLVSFAMGAESGGQWGTIGAGTLMVCLPLMLAFILFRNSSCGASASPGSNKE